MPVAETLAALSAAMQAFDLWAKYGGTQESVITTLNLKYEPETFRQVELEIRERQPENYDFWVEVFDAIDDQVKKCQKRFLAAINDKLLPQDRDDLAEAWKACACRALRLVRDGAPGKEMPPGLMDFWNSFQCTKFFDGGDDDVSKPPRTLTGSAKREPQTA